MISSSDKLLVRAAASSGSLDEELGSVALVERLHGVQELPRGAETLAAGCQDRDAGAGSQQGGRHGGGVVEHVLAVVEQQKHPSLCHIRSQAVAVVDTECGGDRRGDIAAGSQWREFDEPDPVGELGAHGDLEGTTRLARSSGPHQGGQPPRLDEACELAQLSAPADERTGGSGQVADESVDVHAVVRARPRRRVEIGILREDRRLEPLQLAARLEAELVAEHRPRSLVGAQRVCLPTGAVEGQHQLTADPLTQGMDLDERLQFADQLRSGTRREPGRHRVLDELLVNLDQPRPMRADPLAVTRIDEDLATKHLQSS
jgi:hypothetical protein